jgi:hypothetical protein
LLSLFGRSCSTLLTIPSLSAVGFSISLSVYIHAGNDVNAGNVRRSLG